MTATATGWAVASSYFRKMRPRAGSGNACGHSRRGVRVQSRPSSQANTPPKLGSGSGMFSGAARPRRPASQLGRRRSRRDDGSGGETFRKNRRVIERVVGPLRDRVSASCGSRDSRFVMSLAGGGSHTCNKQRTNKSDGTSTFKLPFPGILRVRIRVGPPVACLCAGEGRYARTPPSGPPPLVSLLSAVWRAPSTTSKPPVACVERLRVPRACSWDPGGQIGWQC